MPSDNWRSVNEFHNFADLSVVLPVLTWSGTKKLIPLFLAVYLAMNRRRGFWRNLGLATLCSAVLLLAGYLFSLVTDGYFANFLNEEIKVSFQYGLSDNLLFWITQWLVIVCVVLSALSFVLTFISTQTKLQTLRLKNQLTMDSYHSIEKKLQSTAALRHEMNNQITALNLLCAKKDYAGLEQLLHELMEQQNSLVRTQFSENLTFNTLLQNAAGEAAPEEHPF